MKKLIVSVIWSFAAWGLTGFVDSNGLAAQIPDQQWIASGTTGHSQKDDNSIIVSDQQLAKQINDKIQNFVFYGVYDYVSPEVSNGIVILKGWTHEAWIADVLAKKLSRIDGVKRIDNQIHQAFGSEDLARRAVRAIYSDAIFKKYSFGSNPPIHVGVNNNVIILAGTVSSNVELNRAAYLVDFKTNAMIVDNQLEVIK